MEHLTFEHDGLKITLRPHTGRDVLWWRVIFGKLDTKASDFDFWLEAFQTLVSILTQTVSVEGDLGFTLPAPSADVDTLKAAADKLLERWDLWKRWEDALRQVDTPVNDPDLLPPERLTDGQKKATP